MTVSVNIDDSEVKNKLKQVKNTLGNMQPAMNLVGYAVEQLVIQGFILGKDPYGKAWARPPAHRWKNRSTGVLITADGRLYDTKKRKWLGFGNANSQSWLPLRDTGRLMASMTHIADKQSVKVGTNVVYAFKHQEGVGRNLIGRKIKQRKFLPDLGLPQTWGNEVLATVEDYLRDVLNGTN